MQMDTSLRACIHLRIEKGERNEKKKKKRKERKEIFNIESGMMLEDITMSQRVVTVNARCVFVIYLFLSIFN